MQFIDLKAQQAKIRQDVEERIRRVLDSGRYINGPEVTEIEKELADYSGVDHAVGCSSGTDALLLALMALEVGPGDAIVTTPFTFIATAEVIALLGATPVFVDIDPATFNLDPEKLSLLLTAMSTGDSKLHPLPVPCDPQTGKTVRWIADSCPFKPKGVIAVDLFGLPADYDRINGIAKEHGLWVMEDGAQSFGARYKGKMAMGLADVGCTSFFPAKPLGGYGDGGMVFTNDLNMASVMKSIRVHGQGSNKYDNVRIGVNGRLDTLQAAILLSKFNLFPAEVESRQKVAGRYNEAFGSAGWLSVPHVPEGYLSVWAQYTLMVDAPEKRDAMLDHLKEKGVPSAVYYPKPLHLQEAFGDLGYKMGDFPVSEDFAGRVFSLPMHPYLEEADQDKVIEAVLSFKG